MEGYKCKASIDIYEDADGKIAVSPNYHPTEVVKDELKGGQARTLALMGAELIQKMADILNETRPL